MRTTPQTSAPRPAHLRCASCAATTASRASCSSSRTTSIRATASPTAWSCASSAASIAVPAMLAALLAQLHAVGEAVARMDVVRELEQLALLAVVAAHDAQRRCAGLGAEVCGVVRIEHDALELLLDAVDRPLVLALDQRIDRGLAMTQLLLDALQHGIEVEARDADRPSAALPSASVRTLAPDAHRVNPLGAGLRAELARQRLGERKLAHIDESQLGILRVLAQVVQRCHVVTVAGVVRRGDDDRTDPLPAGDEAGGGEHAHRDARGEPTDLELLAQL